MLNKFCFYPTAEFYTPKNVDRDLLCHIDVATINKDCSPPMIYWELRFSLRFGSLTTANVLCFLSVDIFRKYQ
jgi:hypothetical protein